MTAPAPDVADAPRPEVRPIGRGSLAWRVAAALALVVLLANGSLRMSDDVWPFGPMSQYAFSPSENDTIVVTRVFGLLADGRRVELPLSVEEAGIGRAEIEARIPAIERDPSLLRAVSDGWSARHPGEPRVVEVFLVQDETHLLRGRPTSTDEVPLASWRVGS